MAARWLRLLLSNSANSTSHSGMISATCCRWRHKRVFWGTHTGECLTTSQRPLPCSDPEDGGRKLFRNVTQCWPIQNYIKRSFRTPGLPSPKSGFWRLGKQNEMWLSSGQWQGQCQYKTIMVDNENCLTCTYIQTFRKQRLLPSKIKRRTFRLPPVRPLFACGVISLPWW